MKLLDNTPQRALVPCAMRSVLTSSSCPDNSATYCINKGADSAVDPPIVGIDSTGLDGTCRTAAVFLHPSLSIGVWHQTGNSSGRFFVARGTTNPVWAESTWGPESAWGTRLFTKDSNVHEALLLVSGIITTGLAFGFMAVFGKIFLPKLKQD